MKNYIHQTVRLDNSSAGKRLDKVCAQMFPDYSRARLQLWIKSGELSVNGRSLKANAKLLGGELLELNAILEDSGQWEPQAIALNIVFEDEHIIVVNKPPGLVVHPAAGNWDGTLLNGLIYYCEALKAIPRAGIVHRLDKDTSGLMVVAKTLQAQQHLVNQLQNRSVSRVYHALVYNTFYKNKAKRMQGDVLQVSKGSQGVIDMPVGRHKTIRTKMATFGLSLGQATGIKEAITHYKFLATNNAFSLVQLSLKTGRTHQIRVHLSHYGLPIVGDHTYGSPSLKQWSHIFNKKISILSQENEHEENEYQKSQSIISSFPRQALHAKELSLIHPATGEICQWVSPLPQDMSILVGALNFLDTV